ncbi:hypothetical protein ABZ897_15985 [Nonomuraea sp. NPDC046802]|uniref:hypothetical protein n=1 Tax=Nonomuraea sp. NPDC046802 TaxID=3154919 RepID=UPI0033F88893
MTPIQIATIAVSLSIKTATLVFAYLTARHNQRRDAAENVTYSRVRISTDPNGTPIYLTAPADVVDEVIRRRRDNA